jgi:hypothetical protein
LEIVALFNQERPDLLEQTDLTPVLEVPMNGAITAIDPWDMIPLTAGPHTENDSVQHSPPVDAFSTGRLGRFIFQQQGFDAFPKFIGYFPQDW